MRKYMCWLLGHTAQIMYRRKKKMYGVCEHCKRQFKMRRKGWY